MIAFVDEKLDRDDFKELREYGDWEASQVMTYWHQLERVLEVDEGDADDEVGGRGARGNSGRSGGGGGGGDEVSTLLQAGMAAREAEDNELKKRFEHELD